MVEQVVQEMAIEEPGIPFGFRRIWAAYPGGLKLDPRSFSEHDFNNVSETSSLASTCQSRESHSHIGYEALSPGHSLVQESFFICSVKGLGKTAGLGNLYVETVVDADCRLSFAKVCCSRSPLNADNLLILWQAFFALEFRRKFQHSFGTLQRALDLFLKACNWERVIRDASKPGRTPLGLFLEGIGVAKHGDPGSDSRLSSPSL